MVTTTPHVVEIDTRSAGGVYLYSTRKLQRDQKQPVNESWPGGIE